MALQAETHGIEPILGLAEVLGGAVVLSLSMPKINPEGDQGSKPRDIEGFREPCDAIMENEVSN